MKDKFETSAEIFKAFCDPNRLRILAFLRDGEKCACKLLAALKIGQPTLSHHMKILCAAGIVSCRREGKWAYYKLSRSGVGRAGRIFCKMTEIKSSAKDCGCK